MTSRRFAAPRKVDDFFASRPGRWDGQRDVATAAQQAEKAIAIKLKVPVKLSDGELFLF